VLRIFRIYSIVTNNYLDLRTYFGKISPKNIPNSKKAAAVDPKQ